MMTVLANLEPFLFAINDQCDKQSKSLKILVNVSCALVRKNTNFFNQTSFSLLIEIVLDKLRDNRIMIAGINEFDLSG